MIECRGSTSISDVIALCSIPSPRVDYATFSQPIQKFSLPAVHVQSTLPSMYIIATPRVIARVIHDLRHDSPLQSAQSCGAGNTISIGRKFYMCVSSFIPPVFNVHPSFHLAFGLDPFTPDPERFRSSPLHHAFSFVSDTLSLRYFRFAGAASSRSTSSYTSEHRISRLNQGIRLSPDIEWVDCRLLFFVVNFYSYNRQDKGFADRSLNSGHVSPTMH